MESVRTIPDVEYAARRARLFEHLGAGAIALLPAAPERTRNSDVTYPYRQDSDFRYLTGFPEPEAVAVFAPGREHPYTLFCRPRDPALETWAGRRAGPQGAVDRHGADQAFAIDEIDERLPALLERCERVHYPVGLDAEFDRRVAGWVAALRGRLRSGVNVPRTFVDLAPLLHAMRRVKSPAECALMREAARISAQAHVRAMRACHPGLHEYALEAELLHAFGREGATWAYPPIVGGGANACILHYVENRAPLVDGELLLVDAGCELDHYAADITRTFPVGGRFSPAQRAVYEVVLAAQAAACAEIRPGATWNAFHDAAVRALTAGLVELGLLSGEVDALIEQEAYRRFYMHRTGHWLGMDVHDPCEYRAGDDWCTLEPGMVLTVEPGLYITPSPEVPEPFWDIGVRIEDDVLVTADGHEVLTAAAPKTVAEIEALMAVRA
ncbi:aminopeptidase P [Plasticicumulans lactativorans]|uniref:Xaa-Pro aminopeptidase n=1 Tax=Plasticicumulans lactativorans TaxID=1133106 RepID=A0A4R2L475_9GAMM|nr:Xaa-Pro aminopeptidase [Plasticicumulans lactativorans]TCO81384.1 aminopeptidase P [Plasticicumulans lactativorans]